MAAQLLQTPKRVNITVTDDATALEAVKRLVTGHETKVQIVPSESPHRCVTWSGGDHVLVRLYKPLRCDAALEVDITEAVGPKILGTFTNGHVEEYYVYHTPAKVHEKPDAVDGLARALAQVHALKCDLDKPRSWVVLRRACESARTLSFGERGHLVKTRYKDVAPILDSSLLVRNLDQLEARVPPKAHVCLCHGAAASHLILRSDDADSRLVDWGAAGVDYAAWDLARALHDDCEDLPELSDRRAFVQEYLATLHDEPPAPSSVNALVTDIQYFSVCDNYLRGFLLVERAHAAAKDVDAAELLSKAAMRLRQARAQQYVVVW